MSDGIGDVLRELKAYGLLERATSIRAGDVTVEMRLVVETKPIDPLEAARAEREQMEETLYGSS